MKFVQYTNSQRNEVKYFKLTMKIKHFDTKEKQLKLLLNTLSNSYNTRKFEGFNMTKY
jgi:hypothetical protein